MTAAMALRQGLDLLCRPVWPSYVAQSGLEFFGDDGMTSIQMSQTLEPEILVLGMC